MTEWSRVYSLDGQLLGPVRECNLMQNTPDITELERLLESEEAARQRDDRPLSEQIAELIAQHRSETI